MSLLWRAYYGDGKTFSAADGLPEQAPAWDVQAIVQLDPDCGHHVVSGHDYYIWRSGQWVGVDFIGLLDYLANQAPCVVRMGRTISNQDHQAIVIRADSDVDFPARSGYLPRETRP